MAGVSLYEFYCEVYIELIGSTNGFGLPGTYDLGESAWPPDIYFAFKLSLSTRAVPTLSGLLPLICLSALLPALLSC